MATFKGPSMKTTAKTPPYAKGHIRSGSPLSTYSKERIEKIAMKIMIKTQVRFDINDIYVGRTRTELIMLREYWAQLSLDSYLKGHIDKSEVEDAFLILVSLNHATVEFDRLKSMLYSSTQENTLASASKNDS